MPNTMMVELKNKEYLDRFISANDFFLLDAKVQESPWFALQLEGKVQYRTLLEKHRVKAAFPWNCKEFKNLAEGFLSKEVHFNQNQYKVQSKYCRTMSISSILKGAARNTQAEFLLNVLENSTEHAITAYDLHYAVLQKFELQNTPVQHGLHCPIVASSITICIPGYPEIEFFVTNEHISPGDGFLGALNANQNKFPQLIAILKDILLKRSIEALYLDPMHGQLYDPNMRKELVAVLGTKESHSILEMYAQNIVRTCWYRHKQYWDLNAAEGIVNKMYKIQPLHGSFVQQRNHVLYDFMEALQSYVHECNVIHKDGKITLVVHGVALPVL